MDLQSLMEHLLQECTTCGLGSHMQPKMPFCVAPNHLNIEMLIYGCSYVVSMSERSVSLLRSREGHVLIVHCVAIYR